ncbi:ATP-binding protein [Burkholderia ubonensis]|uniref:ATP-binding protein n=1 Tax=Burkholderia ubonensis TaxID=101571 RepID=UPI000AB06A57|nr:ATP-binding protein [Burkholderia ubonensis]
MDASYAENQLLEKIPEVPDRASAFTKLLTVPEDRGSDFFTWSYTMRREWLERNNEIFIPNDQHIDALQDIVSLTRHCLHKRNPANPQVQRHLMRVSTLREEDWRSNRAASILMRTSPSGGGTYGRTVIGPTGAGKTSFGDRVQAAYGGERAIELDYLGGHRGAWKLLPMLKVEVKRKDGLKALFESILERGDNLLDKDYGLSSRLTGTPLWRLISQTYRMATNHFLGLLIVDDLQRLKEFDDHTEDVLQQLTAFMQACGVPVVSMGTYKLTKLFAAHQQEGAKLMAQGISRIDALPNDASWHRLCKIFWRYRISHRDLELMPPWFPDACHFWTQGIPRMMALLTSHLFKRMAKDEDSNLSRTFENQRPETIDETYLAVSGQEALEQYQDGLNVLRLRAVGTRIDSATAEKWEHLLPPQAHEAVKPATPQKKKSQPASSDDSPTAPKEPSTNCADGGTSERKPGKKPKATARKSSKKPADLAETIATAKDPLEAAAKLGVLGDFKL